MEQNVTYRSRRFTPRDVSTIKQIISNNPERSRRFISQEVCRALNWRQPNGILKDMVCRSLLLLLESRGFIKQPPRKCSPPNPLAKRRKPAELAVDQTPMEASLKNLAPIRLEQVRRTPLEKLFNSLVSRHHYLGYTHPVGEHLKYIAFFQDRPLACLSWGSAPWHIGARDEFIGWTVKIRKKNLHLIANNTRFLILPWIRIPCLGSCLLALNRKRLAQDWLALYRHPIYLVETFVDPTRFLGTCYKADNWIYAGATTGRGKLGPKKPVLSKKSVYVHALSANFKKELCRDA